MLILAGGGRSMGDRMPGVRSGTEMPPNTNAGCVCVWGKPRRGVQGPNACDLVTLAGGDCDLHVIQMLRVNQWQNQTFMHVCSEAGQRWPWRMVKPDAGTAKRWDGKSQRKRWEGVEPRLWQREMVLRETLERYKEQLSAKNTGQPQVIGVSCRK